MISRTRPFLLAFAFVASSTFAAGSLPFRDVSLPMDARAKDLVARLTLDEKIAQMADLAPAISRFGIPSYNWHTEGAHGAWGWGMKPTTVYPQVIGLAASWDPKLVHEIATAASDEIRALYADDLRKNPTGAFKNGLSVFAPNINIFRDPRWGRGQETYGEDPYLTSRMAVETIRGLQGDDPNYLKVAATAKHFAVYSGPEDRLFKTNLNPTEKDLRETYLPAFEAAVREGHAASVMCAYGSVNGAPSCANSRLLTDILKKEWGYTGTVVSDCGAIAYIWTAHHFTKGPVAGVVKSVRAGTDLACGARGSQDFSHLKQAVLDGRIAETEINASVERLFAQRFRQGMFDPDEKVPFAKIPYSTVDSAPHRQLAVKAAQESIVLLKNQNHFLPLSKTLKKISVIGPNADDLLKDEKGTPINVLLGTYHGVPSKWVTALRGIQAKVSPSTQVNYQTGSGNFAKIRKSVADSDVAVLVLGLEPLDDDKEGDFANGEGEGRDRSRIELPPEQQRLLAAVKSTGVPTVVVLLNGGALASPYAEANANAIVEAWYPGEEGGTAIADVLFGDYNPSGRLPITFYQSTADLPAFDNYRMEGRTYRYYRGKPLYPFGYGLSYTHFRYSNLVLSAPKVKPGQALTVKVDVQNLGTSAADGGDEVVQLYVGARVGSTKQPVRSLKGFTRLHLEAGERRTVEFTLDPGQLATVSDLGVRAGVPGVYPISLGGQQPSRHAQARAVDNVVVGNFEITR